LPDVHAAEIDERLGLCAARFVSPGGLKSLLQILFGLRILTLRRERQAEFDVAERDEIPHVVLLRQVHRFTRVTLRARRVVLVGGDGAQL
jgi:hypothetical protein